MQIQGYNPMVREAVGVFPNIAVLQETLDDLEQSGFRREELSVLASNPGLDSAIEQLKTHVSDIMDDPDVPRGVIIPGEIMGEIHGSVVGIPLYIFALATAAISIAQGATIPAILGWTVLGGAVGACLGGFSAMLIAKWRENHLRRQIEGGGLVLWVNVRDRTQEDRACQIMERHQAQYLHVHDVPLH